MKQFSVTFIPFEEWLVWFITQSVSVQDETLALIHRLIEVGSTEPVACMIAHHVIEGKVAREYVEEMIAAAHATGMHISTRKRPFPDDGDDNGSIH